MAISKSAAIIKLGNILGPKMAYRVNRGKAALVAEQRGRARAALPGRRAEKEAAEAARDARRKELLADPEYRRLCEWAKTAKAEYEASLSVSHRYAITVGLDEGFCFSVRAEGDTWDEVLAKVQDKVQS